MTIPSDLDLPVLPIGEQAFADAPDGFMLAARARHPWLARSDFGLVVTDYDACNDILAQDARLKAPAEHIVTIMGGEGTNWARFEVECLIARDGADHARIRGAVNRAFLPRAVKGYAERIRAVISDLLDEWAPQGAFDFEAFASRFPVAVMFGLVGVPASRIEEVKDWLEIVGQSFSLDATLFPRINVAFDQLWDFVDGLIVERAAGTDNDDLLDAVVSAEREGRLTPIEARDMLLFLFVAGYDTSKNQLSHIMNTMLDAPDQWRRCAVDRRFCDQVVEEVLRHSGVATSYRNVAEELVYRDVTIPAQTMLIFPMGIVGRYSGPFENGLAFDPGRPNAARHTAFSRGMHICLGQFLAKLQIAEGLHLIAQRLRDPRRDGPVAWRLFPGVWGPSRLPIAFEPAEREPASSGPLAGS
ncbi:MAG: cytochrome P450 [Novosphingobium sp.]